MTKKCCSRMIQANRWLYVMTICPRLSHIVVPVGGHACPRHCLPARPPLHEPVPGVRWVHRHAVPILHRCSRPHFGVLPTGDGQKRDPPLLHLQHRWWRHLESCHWPNQEGHRRHDQRSHSCLCCKKRKNSVIQVKHSDKCKSYIQSFSWSRNYISNMMQYFVFILKNTWSNIFK